MRKIKDFPGYFITKDGRVFSEVKSTRNPKGELYELKQSKSYGYKVLNLTKKKKLKETRVHVLVLETFVSPKPDNMECRHLDGTRDNNNLSNLCWGTSSENSNDYYAAGYISKCRKLTNWQVRIIRRLKGRVPQRWLADKMGTTQVPIYRIQSNLSYKEV